MWFFILAKVRHDMDTVQNFKIKNILHSYGEKVFSQPIKKVQFSIRMGVIVKLNTLL